MPDIGDIASEREQELLADALSNRKPEGPSATGYCLACGEELRRVTMSMVSSSDELERMRRWCNAECRDDWEKRNG